tara:strand:- start:40 stop:633 length:594 start_codon:yes stop_codon:yes gene_type:complete
MADPILLDIDFTNVEPIVQTERGFPDAGPNKARIRGYIEFENDGVPNTLQCNMTTGVIDHRERFNLAYDFAKRLFMTHLVKAGIPLDVLRSGKKLPLDKLKGRTVYFNYTPPKLNSDGSAVEKSYPKYAWLSESEYNAMVAAPAQAAQAAEEAVSSGDFAVENEVKAPAPTPTPSPTPAADESDLGWLLNKDSQPEA